MLAGDPRRRLVDLAAKREPIYRALATAVVVTDRRSASKVAAAIAEQLHRSVDGEQ